MLISFNGGHSFVGVELPHANVPTIPALSRQADATTEQFVEEWRHETGGCAACEDDSERNASMSRQRVGGSQ
jgi:hypothetical protein